MESLKTVSRWTRQIIAFCSLPFPTLVILGWLGLFAALATGWLLQEKTLVTFFANWQFWQENPPFWLTVPNFAQPFFLYLPTLILFLVLQTIIRLSPQPQTWSRILVVGLLFAVTGRYLLWRIFSSLDLSNPLNGIFSLGLLFTEIFALGSSLIQLYLMLHFKDRRQQARRYRQGLLAGDYHPTVDILIPTYNEPDFVLLRTIVGCQALEYPHKKIYVLDDTNRPQIKQLAQDLGCYYLARNEHHYAKAGNLNHALLLTSSELVAVFDADFIPTKNFLTQTLGFFQNPKIALVQTPQSFYNPDPIARNLDLEAYIPPEEEVFYRQVEPMKDGVNAVVCSGTSFVVRRSHLKSVGYFVTESVSEDYYTGIRLTAQGYEVIYLNEKLSAGLAAESISSYISQRLRWARGTLHSLFIPSSPFIISGLTLQQRLAHLEGLLTWMAILSRLVFLFVPLVYSFFKISPMQFSTDELVYIFLPYYLLQISSWNWLNFRSRSVIFSEISSLISCVPLSLAIVKILCNPFAEGFQVTPKGLSRNYYTYNWKIASPLIILLILTALSVWFNISQKLFLQSGVNLGMIWGVYNMIMITAALLALRDVPKSEPYESFSFTNSVRVITPESNLSGRLDNLSETGASLYISENIYSTSVVLEILEIGLKLPANITDTQGLKQGTKVNLRFTSLSLEQQRKLIEFIYCSPNQWVDKNAPGELASLLLLLKSLGRSLHRLILCKPASKLIGSNKL